jgi:hypothetical protein
MDRLREAGAVGKVQKAYQWVSDHQDALGRLQLPRTHVVNPREYLENCAWLLAQFA